MTAVLPDLSTIEHLDFDHELPCESYLCKPEPTVATWRYHGTVWCGCRWLILLCDDHAARVRGLLHVDAMIFCEKCGSRSPGRLCEWMRLDPLA